MLITVPILLYLLRRLAKKLKLTGRPEKRPGTQTTNWNGSDSEFYLVETRLSEDGMGKNPGEPVTHWVKRITEKEPVFSHLPTLDAILQLHYKYRFRSSGLNTQERESLAEQVHKWLEQYELLKDGKNF